MPEKGELENHHKETFIDDIIQKSHIENCNCKPYIAPCERKKVST